MQAAILPVAQFVVIRAGCAVLCISHWHQDRGILHETSVYLQVDCRPQDTHNSQEPKQGPQHAWERCKLILSP